MERARVTSSPIDGEAFASIATIALPDYRNGAKMRVVGFWPLSVEFLALRHIPLDATFNSLGLHVYCRGTDDKSNSWCTGGCVCSQVIAIGFRASDLLAGICARKWKQIGFDHMVTLVSAQSVAWYSGNRGRSRTSSSRLWSCCYDVLCSAYRLLALDTCVYRS